MTKDPLPQTVDRPCRVAVLTPSGRGAVASLVVFGESAERTVERLFVPAVAGSLQRSPTNRILYGHWNTSRGATRREGERPVAGEGLVVVRRDARTVELHCHGGPAAIERIVQSLISEGSTRVSSETWLGDRETDPLIAEARDWPVN